MAWGQDSRPATRVVTASGGGWNDAAWAAPNWIWRNFTVATAPTNTVTPTSIKIIRLTMRRGLRNPLPTVTDDFWNT